MGKNSFIFHGDWLDVIEKFPNDIQLEIYRAMAHYGLNREMPKLSPTAQVMLTVITTKLDEDSAKYRSICNKNRENAKKERKKKSNDNQQNNNSKEEKATAATANDRSEFSQPQRPLTTAASGSELSETSQPPIDNDNDIDIDNDLEKKQEKKDSVRFVPPTIEEVRAYMAEKGYNTFDAAEWWYFYDGKGWMIGKNKMKNWHSAIATWAKRKTNYGTNTGYNSTSVQQGKEQRVGEAADIVSRLLAESDARIARGEE